MLELVPVEGTFGNLDVSLNISKEEFHSQANYDLHIGHHHLGMLNPPPSVPPVDFIPIKAMAHVRTTYQLTVYIPGHHHQRVHCE